MPFCWFFHDAAQFTSTEPYVGFKNFSERGYLHCYDDQLACHINTSLRHTESKFWRVVILGKERMIIFVSCEFRCRLRVLCTNVSKVTRHQKGKELLGLQHLRDLASYMFIIRMYERLSRCCCKQANGL